MARILLVDDDETFRQALTANLNADGHCVTCAENGKIALEIYGNAPFDLIISDIRMPEMDGVELITAIRAKSNIPFILITGFSDIMETRAAYELGANEFIAKPFKRDELNHAIERSLRPANELSDEEKKYCKLGISDFVTGRTIRFNIFVRLSAAKFIKLAHKGEDISLDRIHYYRQKGLNHLYLRKEDFRQYVGFGIHLIETAQRNSIIDTEKKMNLLRHTGEVLSEQIRCDGVDEQTVEAAQAFVEAALDVITDDNKAVGLLNALRNHADHVLAHSVGVSLYSVMIAQSMGWNLPTNKFKVAMGGLFHDVGMKELSLDLISRPRYTWNVEDVKTYESHPMRGISILTDLNTISDDVLEIVKQHHEDCLSRGYPNRVKKTAIHPMAKLVSVADEFCYRIVKSPGAAMMSPIEALQDIKINAVERLDKKMVEALTSLFRQIGAAKVS